MFFENGTYVWIEQDEKRKKPCLDRQTEMGREERKRET